MEDIEPRKPKRPGRYKGYTESVKKAIAKYAKSQRGKDKIRRIKRSKSYKEGRKIYEQSPKRRASTRNKAREKTPARIAHMQKLIEKRKKITLGKVQSLASINKFTAKVIKDLRARGLKKRFYRCTLLGGKAEHVRTLIKSKFMPGMDWTNYKTVWMLVHEKQIESATTLEELIPLLNAKNLKPVRISEISRFVHKIVL